MPDSDTNADFLKPDQLDRLREALDEMPTHIRQYSIVKKVGSGGFGDVYEATQSQPIQRTVAIKLLKRGMDSDSILKRFELERQSLAAMDHPGIARVFDAGISQNGQHYFVMEFVDGLPITEYADEHQLDSRARLELFTQVCEAVTHAHQKGILHRDLKPSNVLVADLDGTPQVKVIDFGIAKAIKGSAHEATQITQEPMMMGTPEYMSPEQAAGAASIDTRTDVYGMGILLYELLTGQLPFDSKALRLAAMNEVFRIIREEDPPKPSTKLSGISSTDRDVIARSRSTQPVSLIRMLRQELEWIPLKAIRKDPERRYSGARELGEDIRNYLAGNPLTAGPETTSYRLRKFVQKYRWPLMATGAIVVSLIAGTIGTSVMAIRAAHQQRLAEERFKDVRTLANTFIFDVYDSIKGLAGATPAIQQLIDTALSYLEKLESSGDIAKDDPLWLEIGSAYLRLGDVQGNPAENNLGDPDAATASYQKSLEIYQRWHNQFPKDRRGYQGLLSSHLGIGSIDEYQGRLSDSDQHYEQALLVANQELAAWPDADGVRQVYRIKYAIAAAQDRRDEKKRAKATFAEAVALIDNHPKLQENDNLRVDLAMALGRLGQLQATFNENAQAEQSLQRSIELLEGLANADPESAYHRRNLAIAYEHLARYYTRNGNPQLAAPYLDKTGRVLRELLALDPDNTRAQRDVMISLHRQGHLLISLKRFADALASFERLVEIAGDRYQSNPIFENGVFRANAVENISRAYLAQEDFEGALESQQRTIDLREELLASQPENAMIKQNLAFAIRNTGKSLLKLGRHADALAVFERAAQLNRELYDEAANAEGNPRRLANSLLYCGFALIDLKRSDDAIKYFEEAADIRRQDYQLNPDDVDIKLQLAVVLARISESLSTVESESVQQMATRFGSEALELFSGHSDDLTATERSYYESLNESNR